MTLLVANACCCDGAGPAVWVAPLPHAIARGLAFRRELPGEWDSRTLSTSVAVRVLATSGLAGGNGSCEPNGLGGGEPAKAGLLPGLNGMGGVVKIGPKWPSVERWVVPPKWHWAPARGESAYVAGPNVGGVPGLGKDSGLDGKMGLCSGGCSGAAGYGMHAFCCKDALADIGSAPGGLDEWAAPLPIGASSRTEFRT